MDDRPDEFLEERQAKSLLRHRRQAPSFYRECVSNKCDFPKFKHFCFTEDGNSPKSEMNKFQFDNRKCKVFVWKNQNDKYPKESCPREGGHKYVGTLASEAWDEFRTHEKIMIIKQKYRDSKIVDLIKKRKERSKSCEVPLPKPPTTISSTTKTITKPTEAPPPETPNSPWNNILEKKPVWAYGVLGGAVILIVFMIIIIFACCQSRKNRQKLDEAKKENQTLRREKTLSEKDRLLGHGSVSGSLASPNADGTFILGRQTSSQDSSTRSWMAHIRDHKLRNSLPQVLLPRHTVIVENMIKKGFFGMVNSGKYTGGGETQHVAIKSPLNYNKPEQLESFLKEGLVMKKLTHPHVLPLIGICIEENNGQCSPMLILPYMDNGDLRSYLMKCTDSISTQRLACYCNQIADGMAYLAANKMIHRDLAARNCMVDTHHVVMVSDFGLTKDMNYYTYADLNALDVVYTQKDKNQELPLKWMPPESIGFGKFSEQSDVWSWAITCWEVFTRGGVPYPAIEPVRILDFLKTAQRLQRPEYCDQSMYQFWMTCWHWEPQKRPMFHQIKNWMNENYPKMIRMPSRTHNMSTTSEITSGVYGSTLPLKKQMSTRDYPSPRSANQNTRPTSRKREPITRAGSMYQEGLPSSPQLVLPTAPSMTEAYNQHPDYRKAGHNMYGGHELQQVSEPHGNFTLSSQMSKSSSRNLLIQPSSNQNPGSSGSLGRPKRSSPEMRQNSQGSAGDADSSRRVKSVNVRRPSAMAQNMMTTQLSQTAKSVQSTSPRGGPAMSFSAHQRQRSNPGRNDLEGTVHSAYGGVL